MQKKIDLKSMILGSAMTAVVMLSVAAATTNREPAGSSATNGDNQTEKVTGIGGIFFKVREPKKLAAWYRDHLGIQSRGGYADFTWREKDNPDRIGHTTWTLFPTNTTYFGSSTTATMMIDYRVANLERLLAQLRTDGIAVEKVDDQPYGRFAWVTDPEGNRIELWEPKGK
ncbi:MAG TPA: VOC family protein [Candidatus Limnocylindria bacterium]|jgi:catechol-2,3-dioxygenase|nr:VOC family protein [Candidatus Limnocylindria bacterium]